VVIRKNKLGKWVGIREKKFEALNSLGPFGTRPTSLRLEFYVGSGRYGISFSDKLTIFEKLDVIPNGSHGAYTKITLEGEAKRTANIPDEATHFCFCYPPTGVTTLSNADKLNLELAIGKGDPEITFLSFGGYAYFQHIEETDTYRFVVANALVQANTGLIFEGPFPWRSDFTQDLFRQSRFENVTISSLLESGIEMYCFINPGEVVTSKEGERWAPCPNGGFVYLYNGDGSHHPLDRYFTIASNAALSNVTDKPFSVAEKAGQSVDDYKCTACKARVFSCILLPCRHISMCTPCVEAQRKESHFFCPLCKTEVTDVWDVFL
jgi:hypothetical protein